MDPVNVSVKIAFEIMLYGMAGIFTAILIIMAVTYLFKLLDRNG